MAAYAALTSLEKTTEQLMIFLQTHVDHGRSSKQNPEEIESLSKSSKRLRDFLENYPRDIPYYLEAQIRDKANIADEIIGRFVSEHSSKLADDDDDAITAPVLLDELCRQLRLSEDMSSMVVKIKTVIRDVIPEEASTMKSTSSRHNIVPTSKEELIGMVDIYRKLERLLTVGSPELKVISLLGIGGSGKTTLARKLFDHISALDVFDICGWVTVSRDYSARDILLSLVKSLQPFIKEPKQRHESAGNYLQNNLKGKRFFIVLDDVWSENSMGFLMRIFPSDGNKSRILVTTRLEKVATEASPVKSMRVMMKMLSFDESMTLFNKKVFKQEGYPYNLYDYARTVVKRCEGLPILVVLVAGILSTFGKSKDKWRSLVDILNSDTRGKPLSEVVGLILSLSYSHLHHRLRSCLLFMGVYPEDYEMSTSKLSKLWLAQGLIEKHGEAEDCLQELVHRNLVTVLKMKSDGRIKICSLHDMVWDFCLMQAQEEGFFRHDRDVAGSRMMIASDLDNLKNICDSGNDATHTVMCFRHGHNQLISLRRFRLLKTLDIVNVEHKSFPLEVLELFLLKLLALSHVPELPPSISKLQYLETLIIHPRDASSTFMTLPYIVCLPTEIWTMIRLRHLISFCWGTLPNPQGENSSLHNVQTLSAVMNLDCSSEHALRMVPNIKKLGIFYFSVGRSTHSLERLRSLRHLEKLKVWVLVPFSSPQSLELGYPIMLKKLNLRGIQLSSQDMNIIGQLPYLQVLKLRQNDFEGDEWRINYREFSMLEHLLLEELSLTHWVFEEDYLLLPKLKSLVVRACKRLSEIPIGIADVETLKKIEVVGGNKSLMESVRCVIEKRQRFFWYEKDGSKLDLFLKK